MADASDEVFSMLMNSLPVGGMITRMAWGSTIRRMVMSEGMPNAWAASTWPSSTERMPARTISAMYAPSFSASPSSAAWNGVMNDTIGVEYSVTWVNGMAMVSVLNTDGTPL